MDNNTIDISYIKELTNNLNTDKQSFKNYTDRLNKVLESSRELVTNDSINYNEHVNRIKKLVSDIEDEMTRLHQTLTNNVIPGYEETSLSVERQFNVKFQDEMINLLETINK